MTRKNVSIELETHKKLHIAAINEGMDIQDLAEKIISEALK